MVQFQRVEHVLALTGPLTIYDVVTAKACLGAELAEDPHLEVDLSGLEALDSAGVLLLLWLKREGRKRGREVPFLRPNAAIRAALDQLGLLGALNDPHAPPSCA